jgi:hypothetical protein
LPDLLDVDGLTLIGKGRITRDDRKGTPTGQQRNNVFGDAVGKKLLLRVAAEIGKWQDRDSAAVGLATATGAAAPCFSGCSAVSPPIR